MVEKLRTILRYESELLVLVVAAVIPVVLFAAFLSIEFFAPANLQSMAIQMSGFGFLALAMGIAMLSGGIDLSVVSASVLAGIAGASVVSGRFIPVTEGNGVQLALLGALTCVVVGMLCGLLNGFLIAKISIPPILATLSTMILYSGIGMAATSGQSVPVVVPVVGDFVNATFAGVPAVFLLLVLALAIAGFVLNRTRFGRRLYLFGENQVALRFAGGRTERTILLSYVMIGVLVGVAGIIMVARVNSARTGFGESYLLQAILVVVLAGFNPYGGRGRVGMLVIALLLLQGISSAFNAMQLSPYFTNLVWGALLLAVMVGNYVARQHRPRLAPKPGPEPAQSEEVGTR